VPETGYKVDLMKVKVPGLRYKVDLMKVKVPVTGYKVRIMFYSMMAQVCCMLMLVLKRSGPGLGRRLTAYMSMAPCICFIFWN